jgi:uncharacterized repeat protein (TIGR03803 family)
VPNLDRWEKACLVVLVTAVAIAGPAQTVITVASFDGTDGRDPRFPGTPFVQGTNGSLYGTTVAGGANDEGTVFEITPAGQIATLYSFCSQPGCTDGAVANAGLGQATNGTLYGTAALGGTINAGTVFEITPAGELTTLYRFCSQSGCSDGVEPSAGLVQAADGNLYGTTSGGGANGASGTLFQITPAGKLTTLYSFCSQLTALTARARFPVCCKPRMEDSTVRPLPAAPVRTATTAAALSSGSRWGLARSWRHGSLPARWDHVSSSSEIT